MSLPSTYTTPPQHTHTHTTPPPPPTHTQMDALYMCR